MNKLFYTFALTLGVACHTPVGSAAPDSGLLVTSNMNDNTATVLDARTGTVLRTLPTGEGPHEVATSHDGRWAVVSNYGVRGKPGSTLTVIDLERLAAARTIDLGGYRRPHGVAFLPGDSLLAITSEEKQNVLLVGFTDGQVRVAIPSKGRVSHMLAVPANGTELFTTNIADGSISRIDLRSREATRVTHVARQVEGIAIAPDGKSVWVGSNGDSVVVIVDAASGQAVDTLRGFGMPYRLAASPDGSSMIITDPIRAEVRIYDVATRRQRMLVAIPRDSIVATAEVPGSPSPEGVTTSRDSRFAFVTLQGRNRVVTIELATGRIVGWGITGVWSDGVAYSDRTQR